MRIEAQIPMGMTYFDKSLRTIYTTVSPFQCFVTVRYKSSTGFILETPRAKYFPKRGERIYIGVWPRKRKVCFDVG